MVIKLKTRIFFYFLTEVCVKLVDELETQKRENNGNFKMCDKVDNEKKNQIVTVLGLEKISEV